MGFILEEKKPGFAYAININIDFNSTSIDFFGFIKFGKLAVFFKIFNCNSCKVHKADGLCSAKLFSCCDIFFKCALKKLVFKGYIINNSKECCMTAVVRPICINHSDFCYCGITVFRFEIVLAECNIICIHCKTKILNKLLKTCSVKIDEAFKSFNLCRNFIFHLESFICFKSCFS